MNAAPSTLAASRRPPRLTPRTAALAFAVLALVAPLPANAGDRSGPTAVFASDSHRRSGSDWYERGMDLHNDERWDRAIEAFQKAIEAGYREPAATYNIACGYARKGDKDRAFEWLGKAVDVGFNLRAYLDDEDLNSLHEDPRWFALKRTVKSSRSGKDEVRTKGAITRFDRRMEGTPRSGSALYSVGRELLQVGEYDRAAQAFAAAAQAGNRPATSLYNAACARALADQKKEALDLLQQALDAGFDDVDHIREDDDLDSLRAEPRFKELLEEAKALAMPHFGRFGGLTGWLFPYEQRDDAREAARRYQSWLKTHPNSGRGWFNLGYAQLAGDRPKDAAEAFQRALDLGYRKPTTLYNLACAYARLDQKDPAFDALNRAIDAGFDSTGRIRTDEDLDNLRDDRRFRQALAKAKAAAKKSEEDED